jgi:hypothetical protein
MDRDVEIAQIIHELGVLRNRYALYERGARMLRTTFLVWVPLVVVLILGAIFKVIVADTLMGAFFLGIVVVPSALMWFLVGLDRRRTRWIDIASMQTSPFGMYAMMLPGHAHRSSDASLIEDQIAQREHRLAQLRSDA